MRRYDASTRASRVEVAPPTERSRVIHSQCARHENRFEVAEMSFEVGDLNIESPLVSKLESAERVHIIGGPGSGKSTLARRIGEALDLPVYALDLLAYEGIDFEERPLEDSVQRAREIATLPRWITEGIHVGWTDPLLERADVIVWIDSVGWSRAAARITTRTFRTALREISVRRGRERFLRMSDYARNLRQLGYVLVASREYWSRRGEGNRYPVTRWEVEEALAAHKSKVLRLTEADDARRLAPTSASRGTAQSSAPTNGATGEGMQRGGRET